MILYHGTTVKIEKELRPHKAFKRDYYKPWIHLSKDKTMALLYAINPIRAFYNDDNNEKEIPAFSAHFQHNTEQSQPTKVYEIYKGFFEELFKREAYIYEVDVSESDFVKVNGFEVMVAKNVSIQKTLYIKNVYESLKELEQTRVIDIVSYEKLPYDFLYDHISTKISELETQYEADFYLQKFPQFKEDIPKAFRR